MPEMNERQASLFNFLMQNAHDVASSSNMSEGQVTTIMVQMQMDLQKQQLERRRVMDQFTAATASQAQAITTEKGKAAEKAARAIADYVRG